MINSVYNKSDIKSLKLYKKRMLIPKKLIQKIVTNSKQSIHQIELLNTKQSFFVQSHIITSYYSSTISNNYQRYNFSKQKIIEDLQRLNHQLQVKSSLQNININEKENQFLDKQQNIIKDFLQLTQQSFNEHLQNKLKQKYHIDAEILLMIVSSLEDPIIIKQNLIKLYPFANILEKSQLLLMFQLIIAHKPQNLPPISSLMTRSLDSIEPILLLLAEIYPKQQKLIQWLKQVPLYKGTNVCMIAAGFFSVYQKMDHHVKFKNQKLIQRCIDRIAHLTVDADEQTQISIAILAFQSPQTCHFGEQLLIELGQIDYTQVDPLKIQLFFINLQRHISLKYSQTRKQMKTKTKYKILEQTQQGQITEKEQQQYNLGSGNQTLQYGKVSQIQKYKYLNNIARRVIILIMDLNWKQVMKLNLLLEYWKILQTFEGNYPWNSFQSKIASFTVQKDIIIKLTNLQINQLLTILEVLQKLKINKSQLLMKCLAILSQRLDIFQGYQLIKLAKICVTFVRQCQDFLIQLRRQIQNRKYIFSNDEIDQLNQIFKRVLVLFPRPLIK